MDDKIAKVGTIYCNQETREISLKPEKKEYFQDINTIINICPNCLKLASIQISVEKTLLNNIKEVKFKCKSCNFERTIK